VISASLSVPHRHLTSGKQSAAGRARSLPCSDTFFVTRMSTASPPHHMSVDSEKQATFKSENGAILF